MIDVNDRRAFDHCNHWISDAAIDLARLLGGGKFPSLGGKFPPRCLDEHTVYVRDMRKDSS